MKLINNLILTFATILVVSCVARPQSTTVDFKYETAFAIHYTDSTMEVDKIIACDSLGVQVIISPTEVKIVINDQIKLFANYGNLDGNPDVIKIQDQTGGRALLHKRKVDGEDVWYFQGPETLVRLSNKKPECAN